MRRTKVKIIRTNEDKRMTTWALDWFLPLPEHHIAPQLGGRAMRSLRAIFRRNCLPLGAVKGLRSTFLITTDRGMSPVSSLLGKRSYFAFWMLPTAQE